MQTRIGRGVWIMPNVTIAPGITIGDEAVIATGLVVTKDAARCLAAGVPAKVVKDFPITKRSRAVHRPTDRNYCQGMHVLIICTIRRISISSSHTIRKLKADGHRLTLIATKKDVPEDLLRKEGLEYRNFLPHGRKDNKWSIALGLLKQDLRLVAHCLRDRPDLMIGTSTEICHVGWLLRIPEHLRERRRCRDRAAGRQAGSSVCQTPVSAGSLRNRDGPARPSPMPATTNWPTSTPICSRPIPPSSAYIPEKHALLSPLRFAKLGAHHDTNAKGISDAIARKLIELLEPHGRVYITWNARWLPSSSPTA